MRSSKRAMGRLLAAVAFVLVAGVVPAWADSAEPTVLTVTGEITTTNRGPFDPFEDSLFGALDEKFDKAYALTLADLKAMEQVTLTLTYPDWPRPVTITGPLLSDVLAKAGATGSEVLTQALDGYAPGFTIEEVETARMVLGIEADGKGIAIGGRGPVWLAFEPGALDGGTPPEDDAGLTWALFHLKVTNGE